MIQVKPYISVMSLYSPPWSNMDRGEYLRLDLNENTQQPPEHVKAALKEYIDENRIQMYPEYDRFLSKLSQYSNVDENQLILTNGSDHAIEIILRAFLGPDDTMLVAQPEFPIFSQVAGVIGAKICGVPYGQDMSFLYNGFLEAVTTEIKLIVIINPNNPTGTDIPLAHIENILVKNPDIPVIVDEAYFEYTGITALDFMKSHSNLIITRTFSKAFAMAGLRLGYIIAHPDIISQFYKIRGPFDVNSCALIAAEAQIDFPDVWKDYIHEIMTVSKPYLEEFFNKNNILYYSGAAHFMLVQPNNRDKAVQYLKNHGILVRPMTADSIKKTFRMNVGTLEQTKKFIEIYENFIKEQ
ncbi:Aminotransferase class I/II-fold pyridoxal phosphate-dependent enzyme [Candidatus Magnetomoraceae bacterium gMMP-1]